MSLSANFLKDTKVGTLVEIIVGPKEIQGTIISITEDVIKILTKDGKTKNLSLSGITYYEILDFDTPQDNSSKNENRKNSPNTIKDEKDIPSNTENFYSSAQTEENIDTILKKLKERNDHYFDNIKKPMIDTFKDIISKTQDVLLKNELNKISISLDYAFKQCHESSPSDYKISENISKLKRLTNSFPKLSYIPNNCLAALYYQCKCESLSLEYYEKGDDFVAGFLISEKLNKESEMLKFSVLNLFYNRCPDPYIVKFLLGHVIKNDDFSFINRISEIPLTEKNINCVYSFVRGLLIAKHVDYNSAFDKDFNMENFNGLLSLLKNLTFKSQKNQLITYLKKTENEELKKQNINQFSAINTQVQTLANCPVFASAEKAKNEGKLSEAIQLYTRAIDLGQKPGSSVANLYQIFMRTADYAKCAKYLGKYGSKFMRSMAYQNLKKQFRISAPYKYYDMLKKYESATEKGELAENDNYYQLAQKAELEEKNLQNAIFYYKKAIQNSIRLSACIPNLAAIYSRLEMYDDAINLLNTHGRRIMTESGFLNLKLNVLNKSKNIKYIDELRDTCARLLTITNDKKQKFLILNSEAYFMFQIEEYHQALVLYLQLIMKISPDIFSDIKIYHDQRIFLLTTITVIYSKINQISEAKQYAEEILKIDPENTFALSVLGENNLNLEQIPLKIHTSDNKLTKYIEKRIEDINIESEIAQKKLIDKGKFIGSIKDGYSIFLKTMSDYREINEENQSNRFFAVAKILKQKLLEIENNNEENHTELDIPKYQNGYDQCALMGTYFMAQYFMYCSYLESSRYLFNQIISINSKSAVKFSIYWTVSNFRYLQTFFYSSRELITQGKNVMKEFSNSGKTGIANINNKPDLLLGELVEKLKIQVSQLLKMPIKHGIDTFVIGLMDYINANDTIKDFILKLLFENAYQEKILDELSKICNEDLPNVSEAEEFIVYWEKATAKYTEIKHNLLNIIKLSIDNIFQLSSLEQYIDELRKQNNKNILSPTDNSYLNDFIDILFMIKRYLTGQEFDYKAETLRNALENRTRLAEKISNHPTAFSYEFLYSEINERLLGKIYKESETFYGNAEPRVSVKLSSDCTIDPNNHVVTVPLAYTNEINHQTADEVEVTFKSINANPIRRINKFQISGDGRPTEQLVLFKVQDAVLKEKAFSIEVSLKYKYKKNINETLEKTDKYILSIRLDNNSEFSKIDNKFETLRDGHPVEDKSMFYGRDKEIDDIVNNISVNSDNKRGMCIAIYGQTRTGKSSILYHLEKRLRDENSDNVIINLGSIGDEDLVDNNIVDFLYAILSGLHKEIKRNHKDLKIILENNNIETDPDQLLDNLETAQIMFNKIFRSFTEILSNQEKKYSVILMIDEFTYIYDWIRQGKMTDRIMKFWKAFLQNNGIFAVIIGQDHMMKFVRDPNFSNDFGTTEPKKITYLSKENAQKLMDEPIQFKDESGNNVSRYKEGALDRLYELTSGSPFLIGQLCAGLVDYMNENHVIYITRAHIDDFIEKNMVNFEEARFFDPQYHDKSDIIHENEVIEQNKQLLQKIAQASRRNEWTYLSKLNLSDNERKVLKNLEIRDVVVIDKNERCKIKVALYKEWLIYKYGIN